VTVERRGILLVGGEREGEETKKYKYSLLVASTLVVGN